jgi:hypothetical protein
LNCASLSELVLARSLSANISHFRVRSADFESAFSVIAIPKPTASRRSRLQAFRAGHEISGLGKPLEGAAAALFVAQGLVGGAGM